MYKYIIGSGWWCSEEKRGHTYGDDEIRGVAFHHKWYNSIIDNATPEKIIIVDSNSPVKPSINKNDKRINFLSLNINAGHSTNLKKNIKYCGWTSSVLLSLQYAELCDVDYFVYVEQDVLLKGEGIIERAIDVMTSKGHQYAFGSPGNTPQPLQQSFFIVKKEYISEFIENYKKIPYTDKQIGPEYKFAISVSKFSSLIPYVFYRNRYFNAVYRRFVTINYIEFGYGRDRPINFDDSYYYFQHGDRDELNSYENSKGRRY